MCGEPSDVWPKMDDSQDDFHPHNCDEMGCGQRHVVGRFQHESFKSSPPGVFTMPETIR